MQELPRRAFQPRSSPMSNVEEVGKRTWEGALSVLPPTSWRAVEGAMVGMAAPRNGNPVTVHYVRDGARYFLMAADCNLPPAEAVARVRANVGKVRETAA